MSDSDVGRSDSDVGRSDSDVGRSDSDVGRSDSDVGRSDRHFGNCDNLPMEKGRQVVGSLSFRTQKRADIPHYATLVPDLVSDTGFSPSSAGLSSGDETDLENVQTCINSPVDALNR
jgi:hypothetical protein